ncbi:MAG: YifB family Mg chelatase-like AAA ATPase [Gammaproteobacteria bacterium]|nr:YifB family Mg chelatase-like AAA ATPase [Gammaproteobacteria bacterium]
MKMATVFSRAMDGLLAPLVRVEVHLSNGLPKLSIVGLPEAAVRESKDRVRSAIINAGFEFPTRRITVNLSPADLPKHGGRFDLPIAVGILVASEQLPDSGLADLELFGELSLDGTLRGFRGALPLALAAGDARALVLPLRVSQEAALVRSANVLAARHILEVAAHLAGKKALTRAVAPDFLSGRRCRKLDLADVLGQQVPKRALEIAAAGAHGLLLSGPPGTGKSMLASRLPGILPPMSEQEALEVSAIASLAGRGVTPDDFGVRPFRSPHHTASTAAMAGGGSVPKPGEISLAHNGVLFLDELPEFGRAVLEVLREPIESGEVRIARAAHQATFPARFQLVAAMNPCPCGYLGDRCGRCHCTPEQVQRYRHRVSGPLLDRLDIQIQVARPPRSVVLDDVEAGEQSEAVARRVVAAREHQLARQGTANALLDNAGLREWCRPDKKGEAMVSRAVARFGFSMRGTHKILKVARSIADLAGSTRVTSQHIAEAVSYRRLDTSRTH